MEFTVREKKKSFRNRYIGDKLNNASDSVITDEVCRLKDHPKIVLVCRG